MLTRSIDYSGPTFEEKVLLGARRLCILFAGAAVVLSVLDLLNIRSFAAAREFFHTALVSVADLPGRIRAEIGNISVASSSPSVTVAIPREQTTVAKVPARPVASTATPAAVPAALTARRANSPVAELASLRHQDAVEVAMASPPAFAAPVPGRIEAARKTDTFRTGALAPPPAPVEKVTLASADASSMPVSAIAPPPAPFSLSMEPAIPLDMVPLPRAAPGAPPPSPAERLKLEGKEYAKAERCLANAIYFEARSEPIVGQKAVAQVVINRAFSGFYPNDICGVVYQNAHRRLACQFTFACDGKSKAITERGHWARAVRIARETLNGHIYVPEVAKSTHYHAAYVHPNWVREMKKLARYGLHSFYRPIAWGNGAELPAWGSPALMAEKKK